MQAPKTPKTTTKLKLTTPKAPAESGKKTPASKATKSKSTGKKGGKKAASDEEAAESSKEDTAAVQQDAKVKREKEGRCPTLLKLILPLLPNFASYANPRSSFQSSIFATSSRKVSFHVIRLQMMKK